MTPVDGPLTIESLAETLRAYGEATDRRLQALADRIDSLGEATDRRFQATADRIDSLTDRLDTLTMRVETLTGQVEALTGLIRDIGRLQVTHNEELREHRDQIRQILHRLEQNDAAVRRILDLMERRWGGDGGRPAA